VCVFERESAWYERCMPTKERKKARKRQSERERANECKSARVRERKKEWRREGEKET